MITKAELEKMVDKEKIMDAAMNYCITDKYPTGHSGFIEGAKFVTGILMPEIERVENNCDTLENKAIFWMETNDRAIEHTESLQLTITTLKTEIQSLKDENGRLNKFLLRIQVRIDETNRHEDDLDMISDLVAQALTQKAEE